MTLTKLRKLRCKRLLLLGSILPFLSACGSKSNPSHTSSGTPPTTDATGNWQIAFTAGSGGSLFPYLTGFIQQNITDTGSTQFGSAEMTATGNSECFDGTNAIPGTAQFESNQLTLSFLSVNGQYLSVFGTLDSSASTFTGTYTVSGGCAGGASGSLTGTRYSSLSGAYSGSFGSNATSPESMQLTLNQNGLGNGNGDFVVTGTAVFSGVSCFSTGTLANGTITGSFVQLAFSTADASGAQVQMMGTIDPAADNLNLSSIQVTAGTCAGSYGSAALTKQ